MKPVEYQSLKSFFFPSSNAFLTQRILAVVAFRKEAKVFILLASHWTNSFKRWRFWLVFWGSTFRTLACRRFLTEGFWFLSVFPKKVPV